MLLLLWLLMSSWYLLSFSSYLLLLMLSSSSSSSLLLFLLLLRHILFGPKSFSFFAAHGEVYFEEGLSASLKKPSKILSRNQNFVSSSHALKQDEVIEISVTRVSHLHRAVKIVCDEHSQNFAVLQADPSIG